MNDLFRQLKITFQVYNFFQRKRLKHNVEVYKKIGLKKKYYSSVSSKDFINIDSKLVQPNADFKTIEETRLYNELDETSRNSLRNFNLEGYAVMNKYLDGKKVDAINKEIDELLSSKKVSFRYKNKIMFAIHKSNLIKSIGNDEKLLELLSSLLHGNAKLFQSINFFMGSEQMTHSDTIHMTTFPLGGLLGVWIALEDIDIDNGPLHYYPGSHQFPHYLNSEYDNEGSRFLVGNKDYSEYEKMIQNKIKGMHIPKKVFLAKKGDLLIWHANLFHGGETHLNKSKTRKSMVFHYYDTNCICYHEITQRPALIY